VSLATTGIASSSGFRPCFIPLDFSIGGWAEPNSDVAKPAEGKRKRGRPTMSHANSLKTCLAGFNAPGLALASLPYLDQIVTGAVNLDMDGNTRPLSKKLVVSLLQRLDVITAQAVREYMHLTLRQCSERHSQKIALCLRVIENAAATIAKTKWPIHGPYEIESCGRDDCSVCALSEFESPSRDSQPDHHAGDYFAVEPENWSGSD
jgi:hypothetical protein